MDAERIWLAFLEGEKKALSEIYLAFYDDLYRYGVKLSSNRELVKDSMQDLFLKLWKNRQNLRPVQQIKPYLLKSLRNHILDNLEIRNPTVTGEDGSPSLDLMVPIETDFTEDRSQFSEKQKEKLIAALNKLTSRQRELIYLRYTEGLDFNSISMITDLQIQSIRNSLCRALGSLRRIIK